MSSEIEQWLLSCDELLDQEYSKGQRPPEIIDVDEWADKYRYLNSKTMERWDTARMEVARGPMKAVTEQGVRTITVMCCTQLMKTELILNTIGYFVDNDPCPILVVQPKHELAKKFSSVRLSEMIKATPKLEPQFNTDQQRRDATNTASHKDFPGGHVTIVSAAVPGDLAMFAIRVVLLDEIDKYDESAGDEGDPVNLAEERMSKYSSNSLSIRVCSPTIKDNSRIEDSYNSSDMRKPFVACPHCGHKQIMLWPNVKWDKNERGEPIPESAAYCCTSCGTLWSEHDRHTALEKIYWRQTADFFCNVCDQENKPSKWDPQDGSQWDENGHAICQHCFEGKCDNTHAGFWANKMYSAFRPLSDMVRLWADVKGSIEKLKTFTNTQLAEPFVEAGESISDLDWLMERREMYMAEVPDEVGLITAGIDTQNNRLECEIVGWGVDEESWSLDYRVIPGSPDEPQTWRDLLEYLNKRWYYNNGDFTYVAAAAIDMGGGHTQQVTSFCAKQITRRIWPVRGVASPGRPIPVWPQNPSRGGKYNTPFYNVGVDAAKNTVFNRLFIESPGEAGYCHFPQGREEDWFKQLTAEKRVKRWKGTRQVFVWENKSKSRNEAFDNRVYAYAALCGLQQLGWDLNSIVQDKKLVLLSDENKAKLDKASGSSAASASPTKVPASQRRSSKQTVARSKFMDR